MPHTRCGACGAAAAADGRMRRLPSAPQRRRPRRDTARRHHATFVMADRGEVQHVPRHIEVAETHFTRFWKDDPRSMPDPPLPPQHEQFPVARFWEELAAQMANWQKLQDAVQRAQEGKDGEAERLAGGPAELRKALQTAHVYGDRLFHFFTHFRAHLDRNPRDRLAFYSTRPPGVQGLDDVFGFFLQVLARQVDFDYCPRCHLRLDGSSPVCGDPAIIDDLLYGQNLVHGFEAAEVEHSFWTPAWLFEYEHRAKELWYQSLQLPFFRTPSHTATQCEAMMEVYRRTLNRGEANHFMRQCQLHALPITERMRSAHAEILGNTNPHGVFAHGDPGAVSPRWLRYQMERDKVEEYAKRDAGIVRLPPRSYLPYLDGDKVYAELPQKFDVDSRGWVTNFGAVVQRIQEAADTFDPVRSQRSGSAEFPDHAYSEEQLAVVEHWRQRHRRRLLRPLRTDTATPSGGTLSKTQVPGLGEPAPHRPDPAAGSGGIVFPTESAYCRLDTSAEAIQQLVDPPADSSGALHGASASGAWAVGVAGGLRHGARVQARTLARYLGAQTPQLRVRLASAPSKRADNQVRVIKEFSTHWRVLLATVLSSGRDDAAAKMQWRQTERPWCDGKWEQEWRHYHSGALPRLEAGAQWERKGEIFFLVGAAEGKLWVTKGGERLAVPVGSSREDLRGWSSAASGAVDPWQVEEPQEVDGIVLGTREGQLWVQWGPNRVATPAGSNWQEITDRFRELRVLDASAVPSEPASWYIPFRNDWAEEELRSALRAPWDAAAPQAQQPWEAPEIPLALHDTDSYRLDDFRTKEWEDRLAARNLLGGSARPAKGGRRWEDDCIFSVNALSNSKHLTGYGQPQVDRDEVTMAGSDHADTDQGSVGTWEIDQMEQALRDISGRAPGATKRPTDVWRPDAHIEEPIDVRRRSRLHMSRRGSSVMSPTNPSHREATAVDKGRRMALEPQVADLQAWEYGGMRDVANPSVFPHEEKVITGLDTALAPHTQVHLTGKEGDWQRLNPQQVHTIAAFRALSDYYTELCKPADLGHNFQSTEGVIGNDEFAGRNLPRKAMAIGEKRRLAALLQRLWMHKAESEQLSLDQFAQRYQVPRLALLTWFGGDEPATPALLRALRQYLRDDLLRLRLLDQLDTQGADSYSPVAEPGFYKWLEKSPFETQYELLTRAKLYRFDNTITLGLNDPLQTDRSRADGSTLPLDTSEEEALAQYQDRLAGGEADIMSRTELDAYDKRSKEFAARVSVNPHTGQSQLALASPSFDVGKRSDSLGMQFRGAMTLAALRRTLYDVEQRTEASRLISPEPDRLRQLKATVSEEHPQGQLDADSALDYLRDWDGGRAMDLLYAVRRHTASAPLREAFESFVDFREDEGLVLGKLGLDGTYVGPSEEFRIEGDSVICEEAYPRPGSAFGDMCLWRGTLQEYQGADGPLPGPLLCADLVPLHSHSGTEHLGILWVRRAGTDEVEFFLQPADQATAGRSLPRRATASRAPLDLRGTLWRHYCQGIWVPGVDEAKAWVDRWVRNNPDKVEWKVLLPVQPKDPVVARFFEYVGSLEPKYEEDTSAEVEVLTDVDRENGRYTRQRRVKGTLKDHGIDLKWVPKIMAYLRQLEDLPQHQQVNVEFPGHLTGNAADTKISYTWWDVATGVAPADDAALPFAFDCSAVERKNKERLWRKLGMEVDSNAVFVHKRTGQPHYGKLLELYHASDFLIRYTEELIEHLEAAPGGGNKEAIRKAREECKWAQDSIVREQLNDEHTPLLLGNCGYGSEGAEEVPLEPFDALVLDRQLPLLRWWHRVLGDVKHHRAEEARKLEAKGISADGDRGR
eukprot:TRINITY_DN24453_c0_g1_i1.p1 TRINITY_DN24453_c0_g1~~TRINITY_DN24453_c0_g1_i1.p1  ORF type:complete len:1828 (+),score=559.35 TRINITY_DN24453_c0_g1_i1:53-5536(+)